MRWKRSIGLAILIVMVTVPVFARRKSPLPAASAGNGAPGADVTEAAAILRPAASNGNIVSLLGILVMKGVLTAEEANAIRSSERESERGSEMHALLNALERKGVISSSDSLTVIAEPTKPAEVETNRPLDPGKSQAPKFIPAVAPVRVLQLEPLPVSGMVPDIKLGSGAKVKLYGLVKASVIYDSSSPYGTDMPMPAFINIGTAMGTMSFDPGPDGAPEFHAKARFFRLGTNFEWPDVSEQTSITGKFEFDFEGNFTRTLNRNVSTIRSSQASIRLAYGRVDHRLSSATDVFALFGQDWTPFGSSTSPALYETRNGIGLWNALWSVRHNSRFGAGHKIGSARQVLLQPEFAVVMPAYGNDPKAMDNQLGYGERQGADSARPEVQSRIVTQWQLDKAVAWTGQLIFSGVEGERTALVRAADVPLCPATTPGVSNEREDFPGSVSGRGTSQQPALGVHSRTATSHAVGDSHDEILAGRRSAVVLSSEACFPTTTTGSVRSGECGHRGIIK